MAKILLVEDNEMNRDMLSRRLIKRGHEVAIAVDGPLSQEQRDRLVEIAERCPVHRTLKGEIDIVSKGG